MLNIFLKGILLTKFIKKNLIKIRLTLQVQKTEKHILFRHKDIDNGIYVHRNLCPGLRQVQNVAGFNGLIGSQQPT